MCKAIKWISRAAIILIAVVAIGAATCAALIFFAPKTEEEKVEAQEEVKVEPKPTAATAKYLFGGTTFWARRTNTVARASELGVKYPFSQLDTLERDKYQAWIVGIECPVTEKGGKHSEYDEWTLLKFNCDPDYLPEASKYFTAALIGNNHTDNQGAAGFQETIQNLKANNIQPFGSYDYKDGENNCDVITLPMVITMSDNSEREVEMPFGFCSAHGVFGVPYNAVTNMKKYAEVLPTFSMPHMGAEYKAGHDEIRQHLYRQMIDSGVEMVLADHPHWVQDTEAYNGKLIVYSMGNFMFDAITDKERTLSAAIITDVTVENVDEIDFDAWAELGAECKTMERADCLEKIRATGLTRPKYSYIYDFEATTSAGNHITRKASDAEKAEVGARLQWSATMQALGQ